jgi:hypothetical protein
VQQQLFLDCLLVVAAETEINSLESTSVTERGICRLKAQRADVPRDFSVTRRMERQQCE